MGRDVAKTCRGTINSGYVPSIDALSNDLALKSETVYYEFRCSCGACAQGWAAANGLKRLRDEFFNLHSSPGCSAQTGKGRRR